MPTLFPSTTQAIVIGDIMLDRYFIGEVERISPEAPVPVVLLKETSERLGGAGNVALNLTKLDMQTKIIGIYGDDNNGKTLNRILQKQGIDHQGLLALPHRQTTTKTRIMSTHQQIVRVDQEDKHPLTAVETKQLQKHIEEMLEQNPDIVILSDYAKGVLTPLICQHVIQLCREKNIPVLVDPKGKNYQKYKGATALTPNKKEILDVLSSTPHSEEEFILSGQKLQNDLELAFLAITRGEEGISLLQDNQHYHLPATAQKVFDVSGAGDTVIATLACAMTNGYTVVESLGIANLAAGIVVGKVGTLPIEKRELEAAFFYSQTRQKVFSLHELLGQIEIWRGTNKKIVFTNGCFDLLHIGHIRYLETAKQLGDILIIGVNTDKSVQTLKGKSRPIMPEQDRIQVLAGLSSTDAIILFDEETPLTLIKAIRPDILVKGGDYQKIDVVGANEVESWGGKVELIPFVQGKSTSGIVEKIKKLG